MQAVVCPSCGETDRLSGERTDDSINVTCEACGHSWDRDLTVRCRTCGSERVVYAPRPLWEKGRGDQRSPAGRIDAYHCADCGDSDARAST
jgi:ribosomal protein S27E